MSWLLRLQDLRLSRKSCIVCSSFYSVLARYVGCFPIDLPSCYHHHECSYADDCSMSQVMLVIGGAFERGNILPSMIFGFCWATIVYCPLAHWTWDTSGWLYNLPSLDFAGGGPVHIASGWTALAYAVMLGKRKGYDELDKRPHNPTLVFLGTAFIWTGWFGFNVCRPV